MAALRAVGGTLLDARPAFVFAADGSRLLYANAAAVAALDAAHLGELLTRAFTDLNPIRQQMARLSRLLPTEKPRLEVLRFGGGANSITITAACLRLNFNGDERAVLAIGVGALPAQSLRARAERLAEMLATIGVAVAVLDGDGRTLAISDAGDALPDGGDLRAIASATLASAEGVVSEDVRTAGRTLHTQAVRFHAEGQDLVLVVGSWVVAETPAKEPPAGKIAEHATEAVAEIPAVLAAPSVPEGPAPPELPIAAPAMPRFTFELDREGRFRAVTPELAEHVGTDNGALSGHAWADIADKFGAEGDAITRALAIGTGFSATLPWPAQDTAAVEIELTAIPNARTHGYRGFGLVGSPTARKPHVASLELDRPAAPEPEATPRAVAALASPSPISASATPPQLSGDDLDEVAQKSVERGSLVRETANDQPAPENTAPTLAAAPSPAAPAAEPQLTPPAEPAALTEPSNVVRLPGAQIVRGAPAPLSGTEREAFRRVAEALGMRSFDEPVAEPRETSAPVPSAPEAAAAAADGIDVRLVDRLPVGVVMFRDGRTLFANRTLLDLLGYASLDTFMKAGGVDALFPGTEGIAGNIAATDGTVLAERADGARMQVRAWLHAVPFGGATALMLSLAAIDRDQPLAAALAESEARTNELEAILDTATDGVIVIDRRGRMESMNRAAEALFGIDASQYFDRYFTDLLADESQKAALDYLDGLLANGVASVLNDGREVIGRTPSGGLIPLFMTMGRIGTSDKLCAVLRDITHWKNVEEELVAARRAAEAANTQKSDFLAKISHEIRTPLNAIIGFSEVMASERFGPIGNQRYREYLRDIHVSGSHLMSLINDLLDLSKIEAGKVDLAFEAVAVNAAIQECVALMQPQANRERIIIRTALAADVPNVVADVRSLRQILLNLLSNAVKFTRAGGQVIVSSSLEANGEVVVRVRDTGIGMSEKDVDTALKPFRQVAATRQDRDQGTGLGLPLTKALVEANRATFAIDSAPNQGTLVKITFPTTRVLAG